MRILVVILSALLIQGCASTKGIVTDTVEPESRVLVVSKMPSIFNFQVTGTTVFQNDGLQTSVRQWELNPYIENRIVTRIQGVYNPSRDSDISSRVRIPSRNYLTGYSKSMSDRHGLNLLQDRGFDFVLFITPIEFQDAYFQTNQMLEGYGIYKRGFMGRERSIIYAQISFTLFDVSTGEFVASNGDTSSNGGNSVWITHKYAKVPPDIASSEQLESIVDDYKVDIFQLTDKLVDSSLRYMGFRLEDS